MDKSYTKDWIVAALILIALVVLGVNSNFTNTNTETGEVLGEGSSTEVTSAGKHKVEPVSSSSSGNEKSGGFAVMGIAYEYDSQGVQIDLDVLSTYWPDYGNIGYLQISSGASTTQSIDFHQLSGGNTSWFDPIPFGTAGFFIQDYTLGHINRPGPYEIIVSVYDEETGSSDYGEFVIDLPTFDFNESVCLDDGSRIGLRYSILSLEDLPEVADSVKIVVGEEVITRDNVPIDSGSGTSTSMFGSVTIPTGRSTYVNDLENSKGEVSIAISGEVVEKFVFYPALVTLIDCSMGG